MLFFFMTLFALTILYFSSVAFTSSYIKVLFIQGFLLSAIVSFFFEHLEPASFILILFETVCIKTLFVPLFLSKVARETDISREEHSSKKQSFLLLFFTTLVFCFNLLFASWLQREYPEINIIFFGVSLSTIISGLIFIMMRKNILSHVCGYLVMQNGIFLLALSVSKEMPMIVNLGLLLDLFIAIILLGLFVKKINVSLNTSNVYELETFEE